ncbi:MAG: Flp family type IVb pilin [Pseudomonadota bacterium]|jgi:pilus assembly protein Flp/PilA|uniref:Flp family type IVb pilin n=1 Tax=Paraburkholderia sp. TaxID=1926495 RepID=UPI00348E68DE
MSERIIGYGTAEAVIMSSAIRMNTESPRAKMKKFTTRFLRDNQGVTAIEYAMIAGLIALLLVTSLGTLKSAIVTVFTSVASAI